MSFYFFPMLRYHFQYAELSSATWLSDGERPSLKTGGGREKKPRVSQSGFSHTTVSLALTHNNFDSRLFREPESTALFARVVVPEKNTKPITLITHIDDTVKMAINNY